MKQSVLAGLVRLSRVFVHEADGNFAHDDMNENVVSIICDHEQPPHASASNAVGQHPYATAEQIS